MIEQRLKKIVLCLVIGVFYLTAFSNIFAEEKGKKNEPGKAKAKMKIAVNELKALQVDPSIPQLLTNQICSELASMGKHDVVCADDIKMILKHQSELIKFGNCQDGDCLKQMGNLLNADKFITGSVGKIGKVFVLNLNLLNAQTALVEKRTSQKVKGDISGLLDKINPSIKALLPSVK